MKMPVTILCAAAILMLAVAQADERVTAPGAMTAPKLDPTLVPRGKTYVQLDAGGKTLSQFLAGQKTTMAVADCVQVNCPSTFEKDIVCWKCKERLKSN
jgi:hypothetical protein